MRPIQFWLPTFVLSFVPTFFTASPAWAFNTPSLSPSPHDVVIGKCEAFVDKAFASIMNDGSSANRQIHHMNFFVKLNKELLDGAILNVGFFGKILAYNDEGQKMETPWRPVLQGGNYEHFPNYIHFAFTTAVMEVAGRNTNKLTHLSYEGAFFVTTSRHTTYWLNLNAKPFQNFLISEGDWQAASKSYLFDERTGPLPHPWELPHASGELPQFQSGNCQ